MTTILALSSPAALAQSPTFAPTGARLSTTGIPDSDHAAPLQIAGLTLPIAEALLPNSPSAVLADAAASSAAWSTSSSARDEAADPRGQAIPSPNTHPMASKSDMYIAPGQQAPTLTFGNKVSAGIKDAASPFSIIGWFLSAGYSQATNGSPNYGEGGKPFAQRLGAAAARSASETIFSESILAGLLHEDDRYYRLGSGHNVVKRAAYAATRTLVTRTDSGKTTVNLSLLGGNLGGSYLTTAYYPAKNTTTSEVFATFGGSIGGSAIGFVVSEFLSGALNIFHSSKPTAN